MKRILILSAILLAPWPIFGQQPPPPDPAPAGVVTVDEATPIVLAQADPATPAPAADPAAEKPVEATDLITGAAGVVDTWKQLGWLAGLIALINLLLSTLRFKPLNDWLTELDYKWIKPLIATVLGAALGGLSTFETGAGILLSVVMGIVAGLGSVGFHQLIDTLRKRTSKPKPVEV